MDLVHGAKRVIVMMEHVQEGRIQDPRRVHPAAHRQGCVQRIITDMAVLDVTDEGLRLVETAPGIGVDDVVAATAAKLLV
ncbi:hypothetical protein GS436_23800 [Rhodococcus hoagii]|nr:hypothetical protein [Prescottella equi]